MFKSKKATPRDAARQAKRTTQRQVKSSQREMEREMRDLDRVEKETIADLKRRARAPGVNPATDTTMKTLAKQLVTVRQQREKLIGAKAQLGAMSMKTSLMATQVSAASAVGSVTGALASANEAVDHKQMARIMNEFERQSEMTTMKEEMMNDALADAFDGEGVDEEAEEITNHVLEELGLELEGQMTGLNTPASKPLAAGASTNKDQDLMSRLNAL